MNKQKSLTEKKNRGKTKKRQHYSLSLKQRMIEEYLLTGQSKQTVWLKYTGQATEHGKMLHWMRQFGYLGQDESTCEEMKELLTMKKTYTTTDVTEQTSAELQQRIEQLEKQLSLAQVKVHAFSKMIDIAEKEFNIPIRKKPFTKP